MSKPAGVLLWRGWKAEQSGKVCSREIAEPCEPDRTSPGCVACYDEYVERAVKEVVNHAIE